MSQTLSGRPLLDEQLEAIAHHHRRELLVTLLEEEDGERASLDVGDSSAPAELLYHSHLPKLEALGYITWDRSGDLIQPGPQFHEVAPLIALLEDHRAELRHGRPNEE